MSHVDAGVLSVACMVDGPQDGWPVVLSHGFPYDVHAFDEVVPALTARGARVIRPYLRGFGPTRFRSPGTVHSGQQAALGTDLIAPDWCPWPATTSSTSRGNGTASHR